MSCQFSEDRIKATINFHGHNCPGLTIGIRAAELALRELDNPKDTQIVAVVETDMCGVDALQFLLGTTFGKGNLIHRDYGKMAFSFFRTDSETGFRALLRPDCRGDLDERIAELRAKPESAESRHLSQELHEQLQKHFLALTLENMFSWQRVQKGRPRPAKILESLDCEICGERVMESRTRRFAGQILCIPCFRTVEQKC